jgi:hypothetical protein
MAARAPESLLIIRRLIIIARLISPKKLMHGGSA